MSEITNATAKEIERYLTGPYQTGDVDTLADLVLALAREVRTLQAKVKALEISAAQAARGETR